MNLAVNELLDPPRWPGGPQICPEANLPAFETVKDANAFHNSNAPGTHNETAWLCEYCRWYHYRSSARGPAGESNGNSRYQKSKR